MLILCIGAKIDVETISITGQKQINGAHKIIVEADRLFEETDFSDGDMLVLPGGMRNAESERA